MAKLSKYQILALGIFAEAVIGAMDFYAGINVSFALFYLIPIAVIAWYAGRTFGLIATAFSLFLWFLEALRWPEIPLYYMLWPGCERGVIFVGAVWLLDYLHQTYAQRLRKAAVQYTRILETAVEAIISIDLQSRIKYVNARVAELLGYPPGAMVGKPLVEFVKNDASRLQTEAILSARRGSEGPTEVQFIRSDGSSLWVLMSASGAPAQQRDDEEIVLFLTDISERKKSEEHLRQSYTEIAAMQRLSVVLVQSLDLDERLRNALMTVLEVTKFDAGCIFLIDEARKDLVLKFHHGLSEEFTQSVKRWHIGRGITGQAAETGVPGFLDDAVQSAVFDKHLREIDNVHGFASIPLVSKEQVHGVLSIILRVPHAFSEEEKLMLQTFGKQIGVAIENARLYEAARERERQIRQMSIDFVGLQEEERKRFARELHDGLSQILTSMKINAELVMRFFKNDPVSAEMYLKELLLLTDEAQQEAKQIAYDLRPAILDDFGMRAAIELHATNFERRTKIKVDLHLPGSDVRFEPVIETNIYRIVQELLANVAKHSEATRVTLQLLVREGVLALIVADNGKGIDLRPTHSNGEGGLHLGLRNMRERIEIFGGTFRVESQPGRGTEVMMELPVKPFPRDEHNRKATPS